ncbi:MAG: sugar phosphate isomerase/epimerase [Planctomycetes bacterium]|nr:sugar phosphate isomerase/epimerase [Planctomycetota bacterium]
MRYLAGLVDDVELVLFEAEHGGGNLPPPGVVEELSALASTCGLSFTVHLPLGLELGDAGDFGQRSVASARRVIARMRPLVPRAYVVHLCGKELVGGERSGVHVGRSREDALERWCRQSAWALELLAEEAGSPELLAVENLEGYPPNFIEPVLERVPVSRCVDVGHLWLDGHDPLPYLRWGLPRTRVVHIHGIAERDHQSLAHIPRAHLDTVTRFLLESRFSGVLTIEVFSERDLRQSLETLYEVLKTTGGVWEGV